MPEIEVLSLADNLAVTVLVARAVDPPGACQGRTNHKTRKGWLKNPGTPSRAPPAIVGIHANSTIATPQCTAIPNTLVAMASICHVIIITTQDSTSSMLLPGSSYS
jgi:hypothetical protein